MDHNQRRISVREFSTHTSAAKKTADDTPVVVTEAGRPTHVLMRYDDYERLQERKPSAPPMFADLPPEANFDFDPPRDKSLPDVAAFDRD
ncbi:type II toxin-antitoxin system Phd/YefM family antitoxin [Jiella sp. MQZ9-1]|uniref:Antitoxin n=1 Tax=Jiella flava TaxID=2816857 RepID=A0A939FUQ6_9HYPH|nr:type II toxin-antitoxin system Phd/YefM family antitoxin [Jiella flava]MCD2470441.1 type II toxin-antitoxin system Phd/YefM family antitoxin [Jiella flava]